MANGDDKKIKGSKSGYMYTDNLGGSQYYQDEVDEGGGNFSISGSKGQKTLISREAARLKAIQKGWVDPNISQEDYNKKVDQFYAKRSTTPKAYAAGQTDKQSYKKTSSNNVANTSNNNASNGNAGNTGGGNNIATADASIGNININGQGTTPAANPTTSKNQTQRKKTLQPNLRNKNNSSTTGTTGTTGTNRGYTGNTPFNQATANASIGDITINAGGSGGSTPPPLPNITGANSPLGGGAKGLLSDMIGNGTSFGVRKTQGGDTPGGPAARRGGSTPYQFRGLQNQFQSWGLNHYNNPNNQT